jgi:hypothetical protein
MMMRIVQNCLIQQLLGRQKELHMKGYERRNGLCFLGRYKMRIVQNCLIQQLLGRQTKLHMKEQESMNGLCFLAR